MRPTISLVNHLGYRFLSRLKQRLLVMDETNDLLFEGSQRFRELGHGLGNWVKWRIKTFRRPEPWVPNLPGLQNPRQGDRCSPLEHVEGI